VISSTPSPSQSLSSSPSKVTVIFSEPIDLKYSEIKVLDADGKQIDNKDASYLPGDQTGVSVSVSNLKDGVYTVSTNVLSQTDGHVTKNAFVFAVGEAKISTNVTNSENQSAQVYIPEAISRFPALLGQVMIVGASFAALWLWKPISNISWLRGRLLSAKIQIDLRLATFFLIASIILLISNFAMIFVQAMAINGSLIDVLTTRFGNVLIVRTVLSLVVLGISIFEFRRKKQSGFSFTKEENIGIFSVGIALLITTTMIGHGAGAKELSAVIVDFVHNLAASLWIGGIIYIAFILIPILRKVVSEQEEKICTMLIWIPRFSTIVVIILGIISFTGPFLLYTLEGNMDLLLPSYYGKTLLVKLLLGAAMIIIGGYNQAVIFSKTLKSVALRTERQAQLQIGDGEFDEYHDDTQVNRSKGKLNYDRNISDNGIKYFNKFSKSAKIEAIIGIMLLASVALLVNTGLPSSEFQNNSANIQLPVNQNHNPSGLNSVSFIDNNTKVYLSIKPFSVGNNNFTVSFSDAQNDPIDVDSALVKYSQTEKSIGPITADLVKVSDGVFKVQASFGIPGIWSLEVQGIPKVPNRPSIVASFDNLLVKPNLNQFEFKINEFPIPGSARPLFPLFDAQRNVIWFGDTTINASENAGIFELNLNSNKYVEHKINGTIIITLLAMDSKGKLWYVDPLTKIIGSFDPANNSTSIIKLQPTVIPTSIALDQNDNIWITSPTTNQILQYNSSGQLTKNLKLGKDSSPFNIIVDKNSGILWLADEKGKIASINPSTDSISVFAPHGINNTLASPTALIIDPVSGNIFISQHEGHKVTMFNPVTKSFKDFDLDPSGLPFGMEFDSFGNLWIAQHTLGKLSVLDPQSGLTREISIPNKSPFVQWLTSDSNGNIWMAEQGSNSLGMVSSTVNPTKVQISPETSRANTTVEITQSQSTYATLIGLGILIGIVASVVMYSKSIIDFASSNSIVRKKGTG
jgi:copper transport protein